MEQDGINLEEESEQANTKIKKLNTQKVKLVIDFMQLIKVNIVSKTEEILLMQLYITKTLKLWIILFHPMTFFTLSPFSSAILYGDWHMH